MTRKICWTFIFCLSILSAKAQHFPGTILSPKSKAYPQNYFRSPLDLDLLLAGTFAELRPNHFHSGIDIKTESQEGKPVYAVAAGYVSRIRAQAGGFGYSLYIDHPNGYTSVYAHLREYSPALQRYLRKIQYQKESFEVDYFPKANELRVSKGEIIAFSGNTGSSGGPHLHFEIRDTRTEHTINALLFGFMVPDHIAPVIKRVSIHPIRAIAKGEKPDPKIIPLNLRDFSYSPYSASAIEVSEPFGVGIETFDQQDNNYNSNGVFSIETYLDGQNIYSFTYDEFSFSETKYINAHTDYKIHADKGIWLQRCYKLPNSKLNLYSNIKNNGIISLSDNLPHTIEWIVKDYSGNTSTASIVVKRSNTPPTLSPVININPALYFPHNTENKFSNDQISVVIPKNSLYDTIYFRYQQSAQLPKTLGPVHMLHTTNEPLNNTYEVRINVKHIPETMQKKLVVVSVRGASISALGTTIQDGMALAKPKTFGSFSIASDLNAPEIKKLSNPKHNNFSKQKTISFKISDNLSGIRSYRGTVDGRWILFEYDAKSGRLVHTFDDRVAKGNHSLSMTVIDNCGNTAKISFNFVR